MQLQEIVAWLALLQYDTSRGRDLALTPERMDLSSRRQHTVTNLW
jgi:hypothetical protein